MNLKTLIIIVPCYNEQEALPSTQECLGDILNGLVERNVVDAKSRILYVDDGSHDDTWKLIDSFHHSDSSVCGLKLAGNAGHQNALMAGLEATKDMGDLFVTIDADLQDDPAMIEKMIEEYNKGNDIVYGVRRKRKSDSWLKRTSAKCFYKFMRRLGAKSVYNHADFRLMSRRAVEQLCQYRERNLFLRGIVPLIGYKSSQVYYDRTRREAGKSKYPMAKMMNFAVEGITSFSIKPVRLVFYLGIIFMIIAFITLIYVLYSYFSGHAVTGWSSLILSVWFVGGCILIGLGVVGEYIGKIYMEVKDRPRYNVEETLIK